MGTMPPHKGGPGHVETKRTLAAGAEVERVLQRPPPNDPEQHGSGVYQESGQQSRRDWVGAVKDGSSPERCQASCGSLSFANVVGHVEERLVERDKLLF